MNQSQEQVLAPLEKINHLVYVLRGQKVLLSTDLAQLYDVEPRALIQAVKRNKNRFPNDFMFQISQQEAQEIDSRSQIVILNQGKNIKYLPYAFTEQGVAMLSSVLRSKKAIRVNIEIMRTFVKLRQLLQTNTDLALKIKELEKKYDGQFEIVFNEIDQLMTPPELPAKDPIGFNTEK